MVAEINGHRDKQSSEIMTQKQLKGLSNNKYTIQMLWSELFKYMLLFSLRDFDIYTI